MSKKHFGTDGIRGVANEKLTPELAFRLGRAAGLWILEKGLPPRVIVGRDTRRSGPMLGAALASGLCSVGVDVNSLGVAPTGCVSWLARTQGFALAAVISASHNPAPDNGIKLMAMTGAKVTDADEEWMESMLDHEPTHRPTGAGVGVLTTSRDGIEDYLNWLVSLAPERLDGMKVVVDGAHGAAYELGPEMLRRLGADLQVLGASPDGMNINEEGGATKPETVQHGTQQAGAAIGIAFDGDADRAVFSDSKGRLINGDRTIAMWAAHWNRQGRLDPKVVVGTVMSNGGFEAYMAAQGIRLERAKVGDKYVSQQLTATGGQVGGEQSGHIIFPQHGPTGDGLVTALELLRVLKREGRDAAEFFEDFANYPQVLVNVQLERKDGWDSNQVVGAALAAAEASLAGHGRINVRASGTQPMVRVMVEADDQKLRDQAADSVVQALLDQCGGRIYSQVDLTHALGD